MGNENDRRAVLFLHSGNEADDRRVRGDVERGGRLVGDDQARIASEGHGDEHALAHAARKLVRISLEQGAGIRQLRRGQHGERPLAAICAPVLPQPGQMLVELPTDDHDRVERGQGCLRDERNRTSEQRAPASRRHADEVAALE